MYFVRLQGPKILLRLSGPNVFLRLPGPNGAASNEPDVTLPLYSSFNRNGRNIFLN